MSGPAYGIHHGRAARARERREMRIQTDMKFELEGTPEAQQKGRSIIE
jgi:hypothetical protein